MNKIKDISEKKYIEITESSLTPLKFRLEWQQKTKEQRPAMQIFIVKNFEVEIKEYYLMIGIPFEETYLMFTYVCEQPPTFVISDICHIVVNNVQNHGNNSYLINQYLNGSGYKNLEHIVTDILIQEMAIKMEKHQQADTEILFNDYSYLIQKSLTTVQTATNSLELNDEAAQSFFFFMLSIEDSIKKLNQEFMFLYFCFYKIAEQTRINKDVWEPVVQDLKQSYYQKIHHHINAIKMSLFSQRLDAGASNTGISVTVSLQLDELLKNLELSQTKEFFSNHKKLEANLDPSRIDLEPA